jgi:Class II flagellar assembly regulator
MTPIDPTRARTSGTGRVRGPGAAAAPGARQADSDFRVSAEIASGTAEAAIPLADTSPVTLGMMLAAEALDRDATRDRAARRHGQVVLAGLTTLQRVLLEGGDTATSLDRLAGLLAAMPPAVEPRLAALLDTIVLRVRVELARLEGAGGAWVDDTGQPQPKTPALP